MFAKVYSAQPYFLKTAIVTIETDLARGLYSFSVVGLPDKAVEESRDRVSAALKNSGYTSPKSKNQRVIISLAPADFKKEGPLFDLGMALSYLQAAEEITFSPEEKLFVGELSLDGSVRPVHGVLPCVLEAKKKHFKEVFVPWENREEAALVEGIAVYPVKTLKEVISHVNEKQEERILLTRQEKTPIVVIENEGDIDFGDIRGQETAKRGLEIAAAGRHNIVLYGPPGTGKTMLARAFAHVLPPLSFDEALEVTAIHSVVGMLPGAIVTSCPFRAPHHTSSHVSLVGGGTIPKPGEVTLAHRGVLFLDEFPEFERRTIDALRQPLEDKVVSISRAKGSIIFPANFILVAAMNPHSSHDQKGEDIHAVRDKLRYQRKLSGPIVDRIDMWIEVANIDHEKLSVKGEKESESVRNRIISAREKQAKRFAKKQIRTNNEMSVRDIDELIPLSSEVRELLNSSAKKLGLSPRGYHRIIKLSRTIADLAGNEDIKKEHLLEALQYRPRNLFET
ncbi:MAG: YifB family Mg chelatase-like AAA ATPase [Candidatus Paceibacterota bacterium]